MEKSWSQCKGSQKIKGWDKLVEAMKKMNL